MTPEQLRKKQAQMSNHDLISKVEDQITELARTGGRSHRMCVPPEITDTDMILSELVRRFKVAIDALDHIANPIKYQREEAEIKGVEFDCYTACYAATDPEFYIDIAMKALQG